METKYIAQINDMKKVRKAINHFKWAMKGNVTFEKAKAFVKKLGYVVIIDDENNENVVSLGLRKIISRTAAYTYVDDVKIIFIRKERSQKEKLRLLLHEIGHIVLHHLYDNCMLPEEKEIEAEFFSEAVLGEPLIFIQTIIASAALTISVICNILFSLTI